MVVDDSHIPRCRVFLLVDDFTLWRYQPSLSTVYISILEARASHTYYTVTL